MTTQSLRRFLPRPLARHILHFEFQIEDAVARFAAALPPKARVLDAGAGEGQYAHFFRQHRYIGVDLGIGDAAWNYAGLDAVADLTALPFPNAAFDAALNIVTLEHVREPACVLRELARALAPGAPFLLVVPHQWEVHQAPHDYFRYTRYGVAYLLNQAGFEATTIEPAGGLFRQISRRLWTATQKIPLAAPVFVPLALALPLLDSLDPEKDFTVGYICFARRRR
ncbi:MAG: class I SAM-dependent methyltransferase [Bryobacteraceae bacterium]|nr:class I SAM-dependent methyltransferase [Bryobacteraceae bacterium]